MQKLYKYNGETLRTPLPLIKIPHTFNAVLSTETVYTCEVAGDVQACCANGNIVYYADVTNKTINAYNVLTDTLTSKSLSSIGHANGMAYCDLDNCVYIDVMSNGQILKVDGDSLELVSTITTSEIHYSVTWNRATREFYAYSGSTAIYVYDYDWTKLYDITLSTVPSGTHQAISTDGSFIYFVWLEGTSYYTNSAQHIYIYEMDGTLYKDVKPMCAEAEALAYNGYGDYYISICRGSSGYGKIEKVIPYTDVDVPTTNGTYVLKATVASGKITYEWVADT